MRNLWICQCNWLVHFHTLISAFFENLSVSQKIEKEDLLEWRLKVEIQHGFIKIKLCHFTQQNL